MRTVTVLLIVVAGSLGAVGSLVASDARGSGKNPAARTPLERSVMHDQDSAGAVARPPFDVTRVRCAPQQGFCNVRTEVNARRLSQVIVKRVRIVVTRTGEWRYSALDAVVAQKLHSAREEGRVLWAISATWTD